MGKRTRKAALFLLQPYPFAFGYFQEGLTPLQLAALLGHAEAASILLQNGVSVHDTDRRGDTALFYGCLNGDVAVVKTLIDAGADIRQKSRVCGSEH